MSALRKVRAVEHGAGASAVGQKRCSRRRAGAAGPGDPGVRARRCEASAGRGAAEGSGAASDAPQSRGLGGCGREGRGRGRARSPSERGDCFFRVVAKRGFPGAGLVTKPPPASAVAALAPLAIAGERIKEDVIIAARRGRAGARRGRERSEEAGDSGGRLAGGGQVESRARGIEWDSRAGKEQGCWRFPPGLQRLSRGSRTLLDQCHASYPQVDSLR